MPTVDSTLTWSKWLDKYFVWLLLTGLLVNATGLLLPVLEPDGTLYALISKTIVQRNDFINLMVDGEDWLDKPHFQFWITAISFKIFGVNAFAYKLPGFLFWLIGAWYTFKMAARLHNHDVARLAVLIYVAAQHLIISNNDVRAEPYLTGLMIASTYYFLIGYQEKKSFDFLVGSFFLALAVMTKGIFVAVIIYGGFAISWVIKKEWREFLNYRWWLSAGMLLLFILPELISLYLQFDLHPEKIVFGRKNVSGVKFFFWDSQFGRFVNSGPIKGKGDPFFYLHTMLWAFLPWSILWIAVIIALFKKSVREYLAQTSLIAACIFFVGFVLFSASSFQLPHYLNPLFPFLAIVVSLFLNDARFRLQQPLYARIQNIIAALFLIICFTVTILMNLSYWAYVFLIVSTVIGVFLFHRRGFIESLFRSFVATMLTNLFLNLFVYPELFLYQSGMHAADFLNQNKISQPIYLIKKPYARYAFEFYSDTATPGIELDSLRNLQSQKLIFAPDHFSDSIKARGLQARPIQRFDHFPISRLTLKFLRKPNRPEALESFSLFEVSPTRK